MQKEQGSSRFSRYIYHTSNFKAPTAQNKLFYIVFRFVTLYFGRHFTGRTGVRENVSDVTNVIVSAAAASAPCSVLRRWMFFFEVMSLFSAVQLSWLFLSKFACLKLFIRQISFFLSIWMHRQPLNHFCCMKEKRSELYYEILKCHWNLYLMFTFLLVFQKTTFLLKPSNCLKFCWSKLWVKFISCKYHT